LALEACRFEIFLAFAMSFSAVMPSSMIRRLRRRFFRAVSGGCGGVDGLLLD
jgi:hypothetical protein